jgi:hypothetical protein
MNPVIITITWAFTLYLKNHFNIVIPATPRIGYPFFLNSNLLLIFASKATYFLAPSGSMTIIAVLAILFMCDEMGSPFRRGEGLV